MSSNVVASCKSCKNKSINTNRNKSGLCRECGRNTKRKKKQQEPFTFETGADRAINGNLTNQAKKIRSFHSAHSIAYQPWEITFKLSDQQADDLTVCSLISNDLAANVAKQLEFEKGSSTSREYTTTVRFAATQRADRNISLSDEAYEYTYFPSLTTSIRASVYPKLIDVLGPYIEMDEEVATLLNTNFRLDPARLMAVPHLFAGSLIQGNETVLVLTNEVYSRNFGIDVHAESDGETQPRHNSRYKNITCGVYRKADSGKASTKLMVGSKSFNILITASTTVSTSPIYSVGPSTNIELSAISSASSKIYLRSVNVNKFKETFNQPTNNSTITNISRLRQVTSSFHSKSSYYMYRATIEPFDDDLHQPATIFTLCDLPNNEGYGCSDKSYAKIISKFLQISAIKTITKNTKFDMTDFNDVFIQFELISSLKKKTETKDESNASKTLKSLMEACQHYKEEKEEQADTMEFARSHSLSPMASTASSAVSKANEKITDNISKLLLNLFG